MHLTKAEYIHQYKTLEEALPEYLTALIENSPNFDNTDWKENPTFNEFLNPSYSLEIWTGKSQVLFDLYEKTGEIEYLEEALEVCDLTTQLIFFIRNTYRAAEAKLFLSGRVIPFYELAISVALKVYEKTEDLQFADLAFQFAESNKALLLLEAMARNKALQQTDLDNEKVSRELELRQEIAYYRKRIAEGKQKRIESDEKDAIAKNAEDLKKWESTLFDLRDQHQLLLDTLQKELPQIYGENSAFQKTLSAIELQKKILPTNNAVLEFFVGGQNIFAFLIHKNGIEILQSTEIESLKKSVQNLRSTLNMPPNSQQFEEDFALFSKEANSVYQKLLQPLLSKLPSGFFSSQIEKLTIVPDGFLSFLPFEILLTKPADVANPNYHPDNLAYLLEDYDLIYQYSANLLQQSGSSEKAKSELKFLGFAPILAQKPLLCLVIVFEMNCIVCNAIRVKLKPFKKW